MKFIAFVKGEGNAKGYNMSETSIITGVYNIENCQSFHKSMQSILQQSYSDFEWILCDDGSTDGTWELLQKYAAKDKRIRLLRNEKNMGLAATLNYCLGYVEGEFVARQDADDYSMKNRLEKQIDYLKKHPEIAVLGCQLFLFDERGIWGKSIFPRQVTNRDFLFNSPYRHGAVVFRKEALQQAGGYRVAKETRRAEDYDLFMTIQTFGKGENLDEYLYCFCEDLHAKRRRKYRYRLDEVKIRFLGFRKLGLLPKGILYVVKPLLVGLIPRLLLEKIKDKYYDRRVDKEYTSL